MLTVPFFVTIERPSLFLNMVRHKSSPRKRGPRAPGQRPPLTTEARAAEGRPHPWLQAQLAAREAESARLQAQLAPAEQQRAPAQDQRAPADTKVRAGRERRTVAARVLTPASQSLAETLIDRIKDLAASYMIAVGSTTEGSPYETRLQRDGAGALSANALELLEPGATAEQLSDLYGDSKRGLELLQSIQQSSSAIVDGVNALQDNFDELMGVVCAHANDADARAAEQAERQEQLDARAAEQAERQEQLDARAAEQAERQEQLDARAAEAAALQARPGVEDARSRKCTVCERVRDGGCFNLRSSCKTCDVLCGAYRPVKRLKLHLQKHSVESYEAADPAGRRAWGHKLNNTR